MPEPRLHVLWLTENYPPHRGGMAVSCDRIVRSLRSPSLRIDVAHLSTRATAWRSEERAHGRELTCPVGDDPEHALNRLWSVVSDPRAGQRYSHVVAFGGLLPLLGGPAFAAWLGIPLVTLIRGNDFDAGIFSLKRGDVLRTALAASACVGAVSQDKVARISAQFPGIPAVEWTPNGIDLADWELQPHDRARAAGWRDGHVAAGRLVIGLFGQLKRKKGATFFLDALLASGRAGDVHVLLIGDADPELMDWLQAHAPDLACTALPFLDRFELLPHYAACDLIAIPSFYDGMPNVLLESAALGIPTIAANTGGMRDLLGDGENAVLFAPGDAADCSRAIDRACGLAPEARLRLGRNAADLIRASYDHHHEARRYRGLLQRTIRQPPPPPPCHTDSPPSPAFSFRT